VQGAAWLGAAHFAVDAACVTSVLRALSPKGAASALFFVLGYDLLAFAGQAPLGWMVDRLQLRRGAALAGLGLTAVALLAGRATSVAVTAGLGNALFHVGAGAMVLAGWRGRAAPAGVFVAPGALGLGLGVILGRKLLAVPLWPWLFVLAAASVMVWMASCSVRGERAAAAPSLGPRRLEVAPIVMLLALSVAIRSLVGTVGCDRCERGFLLMVAIPVVGFAGKLVGGFFADRFGWIDLSMVALLASGPLLAFSGGDLWLALPGLLIFQATMPVTLAAMMHLFPTRPGLGFGILCVALVSGSLPAYLPGGWRPQGLAVLLLVLGSAAALYVALSWLLLRPATTLSSSATSSPQAGPSTLCRGQP